MKVASIGYEPQCGINTPYIWEVVVCMKNAPKIAPNPINFNIRLAPKCV